MRLLLLAAVILTLAACDPGRGATPLLAKCQPGSTIAVAGPCAP